MANVFLNFNIRAAVFFSVFFFSDLNKNGYWNTINIIIYHEKPLSIGVMACSLSLLNKEHILYGELVVLALRLMVLASLAVQYNYPSIYLSTLHTCSLSAYPLFSLLTLRPANLAVSTTYTPLWLILLALDLSLTVQISHSSIRSCPKFF